MENPWCVPQVCNLRTGTDKKTNVNHTASQMLWLMGLEGGRAGAADWAYSGQRGHGGNISTSPRLKTWSIYSTSLSLRIFLKEMNVYPSQGSNSGLLYSRDSDQGPVKPFLYVAALLVLGLNGAKNYRTHHKPSGTICLAVENLGFLKQDSKNGVYDHSFIGYLKN